MAVFTARYKLPYINIDKTKVEDVDIFCIASNGNNSNVSNIGLIIAKQNNSVYVPLKIGFIKLLLDMIREGKFRNAKIKFNISKDVTIEHDVIQYQQDVFLVLHGRIQQNSLKITIQLNSENIGVLYCVLSEIYEYVRQNIEKFIFVVEDKQQSNQGNTFTTSRNPFAPQSSSSSNTSSSNNNNDDGNPLSVIGVF